MAALLRASDVQRTASSGELPEPVDLSPPVVSARLEKAQCPSSDHGGHAIVATSWLLSSSSAGTALQGYVRMLRPCARTPPLRAARIWKLTVSCLRRPGSRPNPAPPQRSWKGARGGDLLRQDQLSASPAICPALTPDRRTPWLLPAITGALPDLPRSTTLTTGESSRAADVRSVSSWVRDPSPRC